MTEAEAAAVEAASVRIAEYLTDEGVSQVSPGLFMARRGSAVISVRVSPYDEENENETMVEVLAHVVEGANLMRADLLRQLLEFNHESAYGAFGIRDGGLITYHHCLLGSSLAKRELLDVVYEVAKVADDWDDVIVEQAGGSTAVDKLRELRKPKAKPTIEAPKALTESSEDARPSDTTEE